MNRSENNSNGISESESEYNVFVAKTCDIECFGVAKKKH